MPSPPAIVVDNVTHRYGDRTALDSLTVAIDAGEVFALLGPNGSGKTTLFRLLSTLMSLQDGEITIAGFSARSAAAAVRGQIGVVFQSPSVDKHLTVTENLTHHGRLYGVSRGQLRSRIDEMLEQVGLADRRNEFVRNLSGGQRRRVELAKGLLNHPPVLLLDEPSTGLDPGARNDLWTYLFQLREQREMTIVVTTHLLEEAERASRIGILDAGKLVAFDSPAALRASLGGDTLTIRAHDAEGLAQLLTQRFSYACQIVDGAIRLEVADGHRAVEPLMREFANEIDSLTIGKPTLEDVFVSRTGHRFFEATSTNGTPSTVGAHS